MLTSVVRFNYNSARSNQLQPNTSYLPRPSSLKNPWRLIANPRLEFRVSLIRISELKFPNRKFSAILPRTRGPLESPAPRVQRPEPLSAVPANRDTGIRKRNNPHQSSHFQFSNRDKNRVFSTQIPASVVSPLPRPQGFATYRLGNCSRRLFIFGISQIWM
jgi:hypothetical protein